MRYVTVCFYICTDIYVTCMKVALRVLRNEKRRSRYWSPSIARVIQSKRLTVEAFAVVGTIAAHKKESDRV